MGYLDALMGTPKDQSKRDQLLRLALQLMQLGMEDEEMPAPPQGRVNMLDGTQPEIYVAPRYVPSP